MICVFVRFFGLIWVYLGRFFFGSLVIVYSRSLVVVVMAWREPCPFGRVCHAGHRPVHRRIQYLAGSAAVRVGWQACTTGTRMSRLWSGFLACRGKVCDLGARIAGRQESVLRLYYR